MIPIGALLKNWKLVFGGLAVIAIGGLISYQAIALANLRAERGELRSALSSYRKTLEATQRAHMAQIEALAKERQNEIVRAEILQNIIEDLADEDDGPVAGVMLRAFERMYEPGSGKDDRARDPAPAR